MHAVYVLLNIECCLSVGRWREVTLLPLTSSASRPLAAKQPRLDASCQQPSSSSVYFTSGDDELETTSPQPSADHSQDTADDSEVRYD